MFFLSLMDKRTFLMDTCCFSSPHVQLDNWTFRRFFNTWMLNPRSDRCFNPLFLVMNPFLNTLFYHIPNLCITYPNSISKSNLVGFMLLVSFSKICVWMVEPHLGCFNTNFSLSAIFHHLIPLYIRMIP